MCLLFHVESLIAVVEALLQSVNIFKPSLESSKPNPDFFAVPLMGRTNCCNDHGLTRYLIFELESGKSIILDREQAIRDGPKILKDHAITFDRSMDIQIYKPVEENNEITEDTSNEE